MGPVLTGVEGTIVVGTMWVQCRLDPQLAIEFHATISPQELAPSNIGSSGFCINLFLPIGVQESFTLRVIMKPVGQLG